MASRSMRVTACVICWNSADQLPGVLDSLAAQTHPDLEVLVVDNASADDSVAVVGARGDVTLIRNGANLGFAAAANVGLSHARRAGSDAFMTINPDVCLEPGYIAEAVAALAAHPRRAAVQGRLWRFDPLEGPRHDLATSERVIDTTGHMAFRTRLFRNRGEGEPDADRWEEAGEVFGVSGAVALYLVAALDDVAIDGQAFDEALFAFWEDVDLDWRLRLRGWHAWYAPAAHGWHERGGAGPRRSAVVERLNYANRFHVVLANDDWTSLLRASPGIVVTTGLKTAELIVTVPSAFVRSLADVQRIPRTLARRRLVLASTTVDAAEVAVTWFAPFDYARWVRTWWARVRPRS